MPEQESESAVQGRPAQGHPESPRERLERDLTARINPELSRRFSSEAFQKNLQDLMELGRHPLLDLGAGPARGRTISVVGSNGKGSLAWYLAALLAGTGHPTGLYTSPHLHAFNERIRLFPEPASFAELEVALNEVREMAEPGERRWTYFEMLTMAALRFFRARECTAIVCEAGLGGRLDATRMLRAGIVVLTIIESEHTSVLGSAPEKILREKLGIITPDTRSLCVMPQPHLSRAQVAEAAAEAGLTTPVQFFSRPNTGENYLEYNQAFARFCMSAISPGEELPGNLPPPPGRLEKRTLKRDGKSLNLLFDTAHNAPAFTATLTALVNAPDFPGRERCLLLYGMLPDRDPRECLAVAEAAGFDHIMGIRGDFLHTPAGPAGTPEEIIRRIRAAGEKFELIIVLGSHRIYDLYLHIISGLQPFAAGPDNGEETA